MYHVLAYLRQKVEPGVIEDGWGDAGVCVCNLLDLVGQAQHHLCEELSVGLKNICSVTLEAREIPQALALSILSAVSQQVTGCFC